MSRPRPTHFLCIPLITPSSRPQLEASVGELKRAIRSIQGGKHAKNHDFVPFRALRHIGTLHFTLGIVSLEDEAAIAAATSRLKDHQSDRTTVVYMNPFPLEPLLSICQSIQQEFSPILIPENRSLRLHATILNSRYANPSRPPKMQVAELLEQFRDTKWADNIVLDRLAICKMGAKTIRDVNGRVIDEIYEEVASVAL